jgi:hypothetical protein
MFIIYQYDLHEAILILVKYQAIQIFKFTMYDLMKESIQTLHQLLQAMILID